MKRKFWFATILALCGSSLFSCNGKETPVVDPSSAIEPCCIPLTIVVMEMTASYGDSFIVKYGDWEMLVDAGNPSDQYNVQNALKEYVVDGELEMLLVTHMHADHIGAMTSVSFFDSIGISVKNIVDNGNSANASSVRRYSSMRDTLVSRGANYFTLWDVFEEKRVDQKFMIDADNDVFLEFFNAGQIPEPGSFLDSDSMNASSIPCVFNYPNTKLILGGDMPSMQEVAWINSMNESKNPYFSAAEQNIFKSCHHGSANSNGDRILRYVKPDMVFSTSGMLNETPNGSQHPHFNAVHREAQYTDKIYWSGINGQTVFTTNGNGIYMHGEGRSKDYYVDGKLISREKEKNVTLLESAWYKDLATYME